MILLKGFRTHDLGSLSHQMGRDAVRRGSPLPLPYTKNRFRLIGPGSFPRLGVFPEFLQIPIFVGIRAQKKALPLNLKRITEIFLDLLQANRRNITPGSKIVRIDDYSKGVHSYSSSCGKPDKQAKGIRHKAQVPFSIRLTAVQACLRPRAHASERGCVYARITPSQ